MTLVEVEYLRPHHLPARQGEQLVGEAGGPFGGLFDLRDVAAGGFPAPSPVRLGAASISSETNVT